MGSPIISVIIVSWNARDYLRQCLTSLFNVSANENFEVLVVDNDSTDGSPEMVEKEFPAVSVIRCKTNHGFAKANNIGIQNASGNYLCLVNSDVEFIENPFQILIDYMVSESSVGIIGPKILDSQRNIQRSWMRFPTLWNMFCRAVALDNLAPGSLHFGSYLIKNWKPDNPTPIDVINGCFWFVRKTALKQVGLLDESFFMYGEDLDWCKRFKEKNWQVVYHPGTSVIHYGGGSSANAPVRFHIEKQRAMLQYWHKHHSKYKIPVVFAIMILDHLGRLITGIIQLLSPNGRPEKYNKIKRSISTLHWLFTPKVNFNHKNIRNRE